MDARVAFRKGGGSRLFLPSFFFMRTAVYIDGFNMYYGVLKGTAHKWVDLRKLMETLFPGETITEIKYFTAAVANVPRNPTQRDDQYAYWRAAIFHSRVQIIEGKFHQSIIRAALVNPPPNTMEVYKTEEKGSDVNLGAHLLMDAFQNRFDQAIVVTGDSDLVTPVSMVHHQLKKPVVVVNPQKKQKNMRRSYALQKASDSRRYKPFISTAALSGCQMPAVLQDQYGTVSKPADW